jgi:dTDP-4-dehydrorhamnose 3,5-epimerase
MPKDANLLETTLAAATKDAQFVTAEGVPVRRLTHGVTIRELPTHVDQRGSVMELFDTRVGTGTRSRWCSPIALPCGPAS